MLFVEIVDLRVFYSVATPSAQIAPTIFQIVQYAELQFVVIPLYICRFLDLWIFVCLFVGCRWFLFELRTL